MQWKYLKWDQGYSTDGRRPLLRGPLHVFRLLRLKNESEAYEITMLSLCLFELLLYQTVFV
jgi:hypothetical protein